jgi:hypothetical protein
MADVVHAFEFYTPEQFGAVGDGVVDDYQAFRDMVDAVNLAAKAVHIEFGNNKTYLIDRYNDGDTFTAEYFEYAAIDGFTLEGNGSSIKSKGGFNRDTTDIATIGLMHFDVCNNIVIKNLTVDGSNDTITKTGGVGESPFGYGIIFGGCTNIILDNVYCHHNITDGFAFTSSHVDDPCLACRNALFVNCKSQYNGRQGMSVVQLYNGTFLNCDFDYTGKSSYGTHAPGLGLDIEPSRWVGMASPNQMDIDTGRLLFVNCGFYYNAGSFGSVQPDHVQHVKFLNCTFIADPADDTGGGSLGWYADIDDLDVENCYIELGDRILGLGTIGPSVQNFRFVRNTVKGYGDKILYSGADYPLLVEGNRFIHTGAAPIALLKVVNNVNARLRFRNNYIFIPAAVYASPDPGVDDAHNAVTLAGAELVEDNVYETDLDEADGGATHAHFYINYNICRKIRNERFKGNNPGTTDTFRPTANSGFDTNLYDYNGDATGSATITPEDFGAAGDGTSDDYAAFLAMVTAVNSAAKAVTINYGQNKTYFLNQYNNGVTSISDLAYQNVVGITINGNGSKMKVKGGFTRSSSSVTSFVPLRFVGCSSIIVRDLEVDGNSNTITLGGGVVASGQGFTVLFNGCTDVVLENVYAHHAITDCFEFSDNGSSPTISCKRVTMRNCRGLYGARYGLSCEQINQGIFEACSFDFAGKSSYGSHAGYGVSVDPGRTTATASPNNVDLNTGQLTFINCKMNSCYGSSVYTSTSNYVKQLRFVDCEMISLSADDAGATYAIRSDSNAVSFENCRIDAAGKIVGFGTIGVENQSFRIIGNEIRGTQRAFYSGNDYPCLVEGNRFICTQTVAQTYPNLKFIYNINTLCRFRNNYIWMPKEAYTPINHAGGNDFMSIAWCQFHELVEDNKWETDLPANQNGATAACYDVLYDSARKVRNERFKGTNPGTTDTFHPNPNTTMNTSTTDYSN